MGVGPGVTSPKSRSFGMQDRSRWFRVVPACPPGPVPRRASVPTPGAGGSLPGKPRSRREREHVAVPSDVRTCAVCQRQRIHGSHDETGAVFICRSCQAEAEQFLAMQESLSGPASEVQKSADDLTGRAEQPTDP